MKTDLLLLKIGGSLITNKSKPLTPRPAVIRRLAGEIARVARDNAGLKIIVGNGAGSFGHYLVKKYGLGRTGSLADQAKPVVEVQNSVKQLNTIVVKALNAHGLNAVSVSGQVMTDNSQTIARLLAEGKMPVVYGDIVVQRGKYRVLSTEDIFSGLTGHLPTGFKLKVIYATSVDGVLGADGGLIDRLGPGGLSVNWVETEGFDVTGGMKTKLEAAWEIAKIADSVYILNGKTPGNIQKALKGQKVGTRIK